MKTLISVLVIVSILSCSSKPKKIITGKVLGLNSKYQVVEFKPPFPPNCRVQVETIATPTRTFGLNRLVCN